MGGFSKVFHVLLSSINEDIKISNPFLSDIIFFYFCLKGISLNILIPVSDSKQEEASVGINHFPAVVLFVNMSVWAWLKRAPVQTLSSAAVKA